MNYSPVYTMYFRVWNAYYCIRTLCAYPTWSENFTKPANHPNYQTVYKNAHMHTCTTITLMLCSNLETDVHDVLCMHVAKLLTQITYKETNSYCICVCLHSTTTCRQ